MMDIFSYILLHLSREERRALWIDYCLELWGDPLITACEDGVFREVEKS